MATTMNFLINKNNGNVDFATAPTDYILLDLTALHDYLIWTKGDLVVTDLMSHIPTPEELSAAAPIISEDVDVDVLVPLCLLADYAAPAPYCTRKVQGMGENKKFVFCFSFNGPTATEPQLEAWDDDSYLTSDNHVLGYGTPNDSFVKAICTTHNFPGSDEWVGTALAGENILLLNDVAGALPELESGMDSQELYANIKIIIPGGYDTPKAETFIFVVRYTWA
jgi:hypothetical protein